MGEKNDVIRRNLRTLCSLFNLEDTMSMATEPTTRVTEVSSFRFTSWVSWKSIFAGLIAAVAVGIVLALLGMALGFTVFDPMSSDPLAGVGLTFGIWTLVCGIISLVVGGFVGGMSAGRYGGTHGFLVWCAVLIVGVFSTSMAAGMAVQGIGSLLNGAGAVASGIADQAAQLAERGIDIMQDGSSSSQDNPGVMAILRDTGVKELQPSAFMGQMDDMKNDLETTLHRVTLNNYETVINAFLQRQKERLDALQNVNINRSAAIQGLMRSRDISSEQASVLLNEALDVYNYRLDQLKTGIAQAQTQVENARQYLKQVSEDARKAADEAAAAVAKSALMAAIALILGAIGSIIGGRFGVRHSSRYETL